MRVSKLNSINLYNSLTFTQSQQQSETPKKRELTDNEKIIGGISALALLGTGVLVAVKKGKRPKIQLGNVIKPEPTIVKDASSIKESSVLKVSETPEITKEVNSALKTVNVDDEIFSYDPKNEKLLVQSKAFTYSHYYDKETGKPLLVRNVDNGSIVVNGKTSSYIENVEGKLDLYSGNKDDIFSARWFHRNSPERDIYGASLSGSKVSESHMKISSLYRPGGKEVVLTQNMYTSELQPEQIIYSKLEMPQGKFKGLELHYDNGFKLSSGWINSTDKNIANLRGQNISGIYDMDKKEFTNLQGISEQDAKEFVSQVLTGVNEIGKWEQDVLKLKNIVETNPEIFAAENIYKADTHYLNSELLKDFI